MERYLSSVPMRSAIAKRHHSNDRAPPRSAGSRLAMCPLCGRSFHITLINSHAAVCGGPPTASDSATRPADAYEPARAGAAAASNQSCTISGPPPVARGHRLGVNTPVGKQQQAFTASVIPGELSAVAQRPPHLVPQLENPALSGQHLFPNFISESEEAELLAFLDSETTQPPWKPSTVRNTLLAHALSAISTVYCLQSSALSATLLPVHSSTAGILGVVGVLVQNSAVAVTVLSRQSALRHHCTPYHRYLLGWRSGCARRYIVSILSSCA